MAIIKQRGQRKVSDVIFVLSMGQAPKPSKRKCFLLYFFQKKYKNTSVAGTSRMPMLMEEGL
ncbi:hypothetical protein EIM50_16490 [Pseudoxanthomonas sp. SGD-10]|nr:hypothetical protein EIM50_16490 [Pseudoxanthomonas sp. SGD-10]